MIMACGCNGGKPVNLRSNAGPPLIDPLAPPSPPTVVREKKSRKDFFSLKMSITQADTKSKPVS